MTFAPQPSSPSQPAITIPAEQRFGGNLVRGARNSSGSISLQNYSALILRAEIRRTSNVPPTETPFSQLSARRRVIRLAKDDPFTLFATLLGAPLAFYMIFRATTETGVFEYFSSIAWAQSGSPTQFVYGSTRDSFDWYVGALLGIVLLISIFATYFAKTDTKIEFGRDLSKTIVTFIVGFLSGGKGAIK